MKNRLPHSRFLIVFLILCLNIQFCILPAFASDSVADPAQIENSIDPAGSDAAAEEEVPADPALADPAEDSESIPEDNSDDPESMPSSETESDTEAAEETAQQEIQDAGTDPSENTDPSSGSTEEGSLETDPADTANDGQDSTDPNEGTSDPEPADEPEVSEPTTEPEDPAPADEPEDSEPADEPEDPESTTEPEDPESTTEPEDPESADEPAPVREITEVVLDEDSFTYSGKELRPAVTVTYTDDKTITLREGTDYKTSYKNNVEVGTASLIVTGIGDYSGTVTKTFKITRIPIKAASLEYKKKLYTGQTLKPSVLVKAQKAGETVVLTEGTDYTVTYSNNKNVGTATVKITGTGHYTGTIDKTFTIKPAKISSVKLKYTAVYYTGKARTQNKTTVVKAGTLKLQYSRDFTVTYKNNVKAGTAVMTIKGKGNFTGTVKKTFTIKPRSIKKAAVSKIKARIYTGSAIKPVPGVKLTVGSSKLTLKKSRDFKISYKNNVNTGTATVIITGKGNFYGTIKKTFTIKPFNLKNAKVKLDKYHVGYNSRQRTPGATVTAVSAGVSRALTPGKDYTMSYKNNVNIGTAKAIIKGSGNYTGSITDTFKIDVWDYVQYAVNIANDNTHGYHYDWSYKKSYQAEYGTPYTDGSWEMQEYDCASLIYWSLKNCGYPVPEDETWYTKDMYYHFSKLPTWRLLPFSFDSLLPGDIVFVSGHAEIYMGNYTWVAARGVWDGGNAGTGNGSKYDESGAEVAVYYGGPIMGFSWIARWV